jgi:multisubunit Na+/H+ antiporter MnhG subunit
MNDQQNVIMQGIVVIANTLMLIGVIGLVRSGAAGDSRLAKIGLRIAVLASALLLPFEVLVRVNKEGIRN